MGCTITIIRETLLSVAFIFASLLTVGFIFLLNGSNNAMNDILRKTIWFTEKEEQVLKALVEKGSYRKASDYLKTQGILISEGSMRQMTLRIRNRYRNADGFAVACRGYQERLSKNFGRKHRFIVD